LKGGDRTQRTSVDDEILPAWLNVFADLLRFLVLSLRSESALAAENLFLRKQLG
jgi:hypothetical protein